MESRMLALACVSILVVSVSLHGTASVGASPTESYAIRIEVRQGGIDSISFIFQSDLALFHSTPTTGPAVEVYPALLDLYIFSGSDPTVSNVPGAMVSVLGIPTHQNCVGSIDGRLACWKNPGTPTTVYQRTVGPATDIVAVGEGCIIVSYTDGRPPLTVDDIPLVASGALTPGESCP